MAGIEYITVADLELALAALNGVVAVAECQYKSYASTYTTFCNDGFIYCIVDKDCKQTTGWTIDHVVKSPSLNTMSLTISDSADYLARLPTATGLEITFDHTSIRAVGDLDPGSKTATISFVNNAGIDLSNATFPKSITAIYVDRRRAVDLLYKRKIVESQLLVFPRTIPFDTLSVFYGNDNKFTSLENVDFGKAEAIYAAHDADHLDTRVALDAIGNTNLSTFTVSQTTYERLGRARNFFVGGIDVGRTCLAPNKTAPLHSHTVCVMPTFSLRYELIDVAEVTPAPTNATRGNVTPILSLVPSTIDPSRPESTKEPSAPSAPVIAGITASVVLVVILVALCFVRRQKMKNTEPKDGYHGAAIDLADGLKYDDQLDLSDLMLLRLDDLELVQSTFLAQGAYGQVWLGAYRDHPVVIKCLLPDRASTKDLVHFADEIRLSARMDSPYIVRMLGASWRVPSELQMVLEWMDRGDLKRVLDTTSPASFLWDAKTDCMLAMAEGLVYLHSLDVIHRDLKARNVLLDSKKGTKLTDFGVSRIATTETMTMSVGTYCWMAPEILQDCHYSTAADVYSFGVILTELATHHTPYHDLCNDKGIPLSDTAIISRVVRGEVQPSIPPASCPPWVRELALECLALTPEARPNAMRIAYTIATQLHMPRARASSHSIFVSVTCLSG
ncbi:protein kinase [Achlya hypogyna]|uniref:Protein kinase n=1 Tax=Achlya hypogyna TaxID=1202772 RepID=A0A1V9YUA0_ACHHY|nr:protein kinase [Achlya hypogyna]